tara:strand:- start:2980 stop:3681 length:702 start_codon:yes stop_codon:yes gene_type:complete
MRIAKYISHSGYCSRRNAEKLILANKVKINSKICATLSTKIAKSDTVKIDNKIINLNKLIRIWCFYKPLGIINTSKDTHNRKTIFDLLPKKLKNLISVGRLDINSEGLLLLTNNGELSRYFELPKNSFRRQYRVRVQGIVDKNKLSILKKGIKIKNFSYKPIIADLEKQSNTNAWIKMTITEGKNREIRKICSHFGWRVNRLIRIKYGEFSIGNLKPGEIKEIKKHNYINFNA